MALNRDFVGRLCVSEESYEVGREKLKEFADAIQDPYLGYRSRAAAQDDGHEDAVAPPTFAGVVTAGSATPLLFDPDFGLDYTRVVHGEQRFRHRRPIRAGDVLSTRSRILSVRDVGSNEVVETETEIIDAGGDLICVATNVIVSRGTGGATEASA